MMSSIIPANEYCVKIFDGTHDTPKSVKNGRPLVTSKNILGGKLNLIDTYNISEENYRSIQKRSAVSQWDVLFSMIGSIGEVYLEKNKDISYAIKNVGVFSCGDEYKAKWLYYYLLSPASKTFIKNYLVGAVQKFLALGTLREYPVLLFDSSKKGSVDLLYVLDSKIELNNQINAELESMAKTLYDYWFVQFDFSNKNDKPYKTSGGKMVFNEKLKKEIPEGWEVKNLKNNSLTKLLKPKIDKFKNEKIYLATADVQSNEINFQAEKIIFDDRPSRANMQPIENSVWFAKMKNSKKILYFGNYSKEFLEKSILSTGFTGLKCNKEYYLEYIWGFIKNDYFELVKDTIASASTQEAINNDEMAFIKLVIPTDDILKKYNDKTKGIYQKIYKNQIANQKLVELRDWLLPMLMNGQVTVN